LDHYIPELDANTPKQFEIALDGQTAVQIPLLNRSWSYYIVTIGGLETGTHVLDAVIWREDADTPGSPEWTGEQSLVSDRVHYLSEGIHVPKISSFRPKVDDVFNVILRKRMQINEFGSMSWPCKVAENASCTLVEVTEAWPANETAIIVLDMWAYHGCEAASLRTAAMVEKMNQVLISARNHGVMIIFSPSSGVDEMAPSFPTQRRRMADAAAHCADARTCGAAGVTHAGQGIAADPQREPPLPIAGGCDGGEEREWGDASHAQHPGLAVFPEDGLSDSAQEIVGYLRADGRRRVVLAGVHANECLLRRPFALRRLPAEGFAVAVARDLTDVLHDPRRGPPVSHARATAMVLRHIEAYLAPTLRSADLARAVHDDPE
jgi:nicotinamidase-related amidase